MGSEKGARVLIVDLTFELSCSFFCVSWAGTPLKGSIEQLSHHGVGLWEPPFSPSFSCLVKATGGGRVSNEGMNVPSCGSQKMIEKCSFPHDHY